MKLKNMQVILYMNPYHKKGIYDFNLKRLFTSLFKYSYPRFQQVIHIENLLFKFPLCGKNVILWISLLSGAK